MPKYTWIYLIKDEDTGYYKIGQSVDPEQRLAQLCKQATLQPTPNNFTLEEAWLASPETEKEAHEIFHEARVRGEWFRFDDEDLKEVYALLSHYTRWFLGRSDDHEHVDAYCSHLEDISRRDRHHLAELEHYIAQQDRKIAHLKERNRRLANPGWLDLELQKISKRCQEAQTS